MPQTTETLFARRLLVQPGAESTRRNVRIEISAGSIAAVEAAEALAPAERAAPDHLAMPALADAHDHGRGLKYLAYGGSDRPLEAWLPSIYFQPEVDPYLSALLAMARLARAGVGAAVHCHIVNRPECFEDEIRAVARAADDLGIRLALAVPMRDRNLLAYGEDDDLLSLLSPEDRAEVERLWRQPPLPAREQLARVERLAAEVETELVEVLYSPVGVQWASDELLKLVAEASARTGRRVHMHFLETRYQREWADAAYPEGVIGFLDEIGLLSPRLTLAHGVWLRPDEMVRLAEREVIVSVNTCSNLRLRSGIAPVREFLAKSVPFAFGVDALALDDDDDALRDLKLAYLLHNGPGFDEALSTAALFHAAIGVGGRAVTGKTGFGALRPGAPADLLIIDYGAMARDIIDGLSDEVAVLLARGNSRFVHTLYVAGRKVVEAGSVVGLDMEALEADLTRQTVEGGDLLHGIRPLVGRYQDALMRFYSDKRHMRRKVPGQ